jgi:hypothetical protein
VSEQGAVQVADRKDVKSAELELEEPVIPETGLSSDDDAQTPAGRIVHDDRGNAVWKWVGDTTATGGGSGILKHLDANDLKVEGHSGRFVAARGTPPPPADAGGGYDPYNQGDPKKAAAPRKSGRIKP